jgi:hypothetical protein
LERLSGILQLKKDLETGIRWRSDRPLRWAMIHANQASIVSSYRFLSFSIPLCYPALMARRAGRIDHVGDQAGRNFYP